VQHAFQGLQVAVDVGDDGQPHKRWVRVLGSGFWVIRQGSR
jgi:hypothetical protein